jgi:hypothetical protein
MIEIFPTFHQGPHGALYQRQRVSQREAPAQRLAVSSEKLMQVTKAAVDSCVGRFSKWWTKWILNYKPKTSFRGRLFKDAGEIFHIQIRE